MKFDYQKFILGQHDPRKPLVARPYIPVYLIGTERKTPSPYYALLDSGADRVLFPADLAEAVGITRIETGELEPTVGISNQRVDVYYHKLVLQVLGDTRSLPTDIGFSKNILFPILGRSFFKHFKTVTFNESREEVELRS